MFLSTKRRLVRNREVSFEIEVVRAGLETTGSTWDRKREESKKVRYGTVRYDQVMSGPVKLCHVRFGQVRSGQVRYGQVWSGQVRSGQVRSGQEQNVPIILATNVSAKYGTPTAGREYISGASKFRFRATKSMRQQQAQPQAVGTVAGAQ